MISYRALTAGLAMAGLAVTGQQIFDADDAPDHKAMALLRTERAVAKSFNLLTASMPEAMYEPVHPTPVVQTRFTVTPDGALVINDDTRTVLDMLAGSLPERPDASTMRELEKLARAGLPERAATEISSLLANYLAYKAAEVDLLKQQRADASLSPTDALQQLAALRRRHFDAATANVLFTGDEARMRYDIGAAAINADGRITEIAKQEKKAALRELIAQQSGMQLEGESIDDELLRLHRHVVALRLKGRTEIEVMQVREQVLGADAAANLNEMERYQVEWERRSKEFDEKKAALPEPASAVGTHEAVDALLRQIYREPELAAARAYNLARQEPR